MSGFVLFLVIYYAFSIGLNMAFIAYTAAVGPIEIGPGTYFTSVLVCTGLLIGTLIFLV